MEYRWKTGDRVNVLTGPKETALNTIGMFCFTGVGLQFSRNRIKHKRFHYQEKIIPHRKSCSNSIDKFVVERKQ